MKRLRFGFAISFAIFLISLFVVYPSFALENQKLYEGRYQLVTAQYEDKDGNVHPVVYRIDTMTGNTSIVNYVAEEISGKKVKFFVFGEVHKDTRELLRHIQTLKEVFEKK